MTTIPEPLVLTDEERREIEGVPALEPAGACAHEFTRPASVDGPDRLCVSCLDYLPAPAHSP